MGSCLQKNVNVTFDEKPLVHHQSHHSQSSQSQLYQLNDLRSLEGVSRIWSNKMKSRTHHPNGLLKLQPATSVRVKGNHSSNPFAPISISTYYFIHAPNAQNQPNLLHSHSAPPKLTHKALGNLLREHKNNQQKDNTNNNNDNIVELSLPEPDAAPPPITSRKISNIHTLSPIASPTLQIPESPQWIHTTPMHTHGHGHTNGYTSQQPMVPMPMVPVFSFSNSLGSENIAMGPLELDDINSHNNGFHLNIGFNSGDNINDTSKGVHDDTIQWVPVKHTYSNRNVFTLADNNLSVDDFMEYETNSAFTIGVGAGASGIVKKAFHFSSCKMVAIKQCRSKQEHEVLAFEREGQLYKKFTNNKYIIDIIGFGRGDMNNELLMALEYMDKGR
eukprot:973043_1